MSYVIGIIFLTRNHVLCVNYDNTLSKFFKDLEMQFNSVARISKKNVSDDKLDKGVVINPEHNIGKSKLIEYDVSSSLLFLDEKDLAENHISTLDECIHGTGKFSKLNYFSEIIDVLPNILFKPFSSLFTTMSFTYGTAKLNYYVMMVFSPMDWYINPADISYIKTYEESDVHDDDKSDNDTKNKEQNYKSNTDAVSVGKSNTVILDAGTIQSKLSSSTIVSARNVKVVSMNEILTTLHDVDRRIITHASRYLITYANSSVTMGTQSNIWKNVNLQSVMKNTREGKKSLFSIPVATLKSSKYSDDQVDGSTGITKNYENNNSKNNNSNKNKEDGKNDTKNENPGTSDFMSSTPNPSDLMSLNEMSGHKKSIGKKYKKRKN